TNRKDNVLMVPLSTVTTRNPDEVSEEAGEGKEQPAETSNRAEEKQSGISKKKADKIVVFVKEGGVAKMTEVKTGISDYDNMEIVSGLKTGQEVISGPFSAVSKRLKDGDKVKLKEKDDKEAATKP
ncbi:MAG: efflux transporter periplasmic adaptor subunit, partial [Bacteroidota bacterium]